MYAWAAGGRYASSSRCLRAACQLTAAPGTQAGAHAPADALADVEHVDALGAEHGAQAVVAQDLPPVARVLQLPRAVSGGGGRTERGCGLRRAP
jgi:hypothetical protein